MDVTQSWLEPHLSFQHDVFGLEDPPVFQTTVINCIYRISLEKPLLTLCRQIP
ncbi:MAG: hypothetical protein AB8B64_25150 [Granulosicoccus sp.]